MSELRDPTDLLVSPDHGADPVWSADGAEMIALESLPISDALRTDLRDWARRWEGLSWQREGAGSGTSDGDVAGAGDESKESHDTDGEALAERLRSELGDGWSVALRPPATQAHSAG